MEENVVATAIFDYVSNTSLKEVGGGKKMKTNLNIILHLFCCEMFPVKTLSSVWCDLKVKMKREKKNLISKPTSHHKISTIQPNHPADRHNPSQPPTKSVPV